MIEIPLTKGQIAFIDDEDYVLVSQYKWHASKDHDRDKYYARSRNKKGCFPTGILMHRLIMNAQYGQQVDHKNGNSLDNRRKNLRICSYSENQRNSSFSRGKSKYRGVTWNKNMRLWMVRIMYNNKRLFIGYFKDELEAANAYDEAVIKYHGEFGYKGDTNE